jgi:radical SAM superfamily enzyme YgiQ (UPF0313 family)
MTVDILLVGQPTPYVNSSASQPLGLTLIAGDLEDYGYRGRVGIIDGYLLSVKYGYEKAIKMIQNQIREEKPISTGFGVYNLYRPAELKMIKTAREVGSEVTFGGTMARVYYELYVMGGPVVMGEGEGVFRELTDKLFNGERIKDVKGIAFFDENEKKVVITPKREPIDINKISLPAWHLLPPVSEYGYIIPIEESRRCTGSCTFCTAYMIHQDVEEVNKILEEGKSIPVILPSLKTPENIELEAKIAKDLGATNIHLRGENVLLQRERALKIGDIMAKYSSNWGINACANFVVNQKDILPELKEKKLSHVLVGVEAGSQPTLDLYSKHTTVEKNQEALDILWKCNITAVIGYIPFNLFMDLSHLKENILFAYKNFWQFTNGGNYPEEIIFKEWHPDKGTPLYEKALREGLLKEIWSSEGLTLAHRYKDPKVEQVLDWVKYYLQKYHQTSIRLIDKNYETLKNLPIAKRLKRMPLDVLYMACEAAEKVSDGQKTIDLFCQKQLQELEGILVMPIIAKQTHIKN